MNRHVDHQVLLDAISTMPIQPISKDVLREKYLKPGEDNVSQLFDRVARALASVEPVELRAEFEVLFRQNLEAGAIGAGRIMSAAGTGIQATLINCFVQPVGDCIQGVDGGGYPGIYEALREAAETMRRGGGVGGGGRGRVRHDVGGRKGRRRARRRRAPGPAARGARGWSRAPPRRGSSAWRPRAPEPAWNHCCSPRFPSGRIGLRPRPAAPGHRTPSASPLHHPRPPPP
jgi:hypothetical protein